MPASTEPPGRAARARCATTNCGQAGIRLAVKADCLLRLCERCAHDRDDVTILDVSGAFVAPSRWT